MADWKPGKSWGGGGGQGGAAKVRSAAPTRALPGERPGLLGRARNDLSAFWSSLPKLPGAIKHEAAKFNPNSAESAELERKGRIARQQGGGEPLRHFLQETPLVNLIPGTYVAGELVRGKKGRAELSEHPVLGLMDVLPYVGKAGKVATKGGKLAASAEKTARTLGKTAKADRIAKKGLKLPEIAKEAGKLAEKKIAAKNPNLANKLPSALLERSGIGGERLRSMMEILGTTNRKVAREYEETLKPVFKEAERLGLKQDDLNRIMDTASQGKPGWREALSPDELGFLDETIQPLQARFRQKLLDEGELVARNGETFAKAEIAPLVRAEKKLEFLNNKLTKRLAETTQQAVEADLLAAKRGRPRPHLARLQEDQAKLVEQVARLEKNLVPARAKEMLQPQKVEAVMDIVRKRTPDLDETTASRIVDYLRSGGSTANLGDTFGVRFDPRDYARLTRGLVKTWQKLKAEGHDPQWFHQASEQGARQMSRRSINPERIISASQAKRRSWDPRPWVRDIQVSVSHQAYEVIHREGVRTFLDEMTNAGMLKPRSQVLRDLLELAGDEKGVAARMDRILKRDWEVFEPDKLFSGAPTIGTAGDPVLIPKGLRHALEQMRPPANPFSRAAAAGTSLFRIGVLRLNPFYYINNLLGNAPMMVARSDPKALFKLPEAIQKLRSGELPPELARGPRDQIRAAVAKENYQAGRVMGDLVAENPRLFQGFRDKAGKVVPFLDGLSGMLDDMYKVATYLRESEKAAKRGASREVALQAGVDAAHKVFSNMDRLTPLERTVVRNAIPFYSWSKHILGYVMTYPFDHPLRASIMASLTRQQLEDWNSGIPQRFQNYLYLGQPNADGDQKMLSIGGIIPMVGAANLLTYAGIASRLDPRIQVLLQQSGVDPMTYTGDQFAPLRFDPVSGRETRERPPLTRAIPEAFLPQAAGLLELAKPTPDMQRLKQSNPEAYNRWLRGAFGFSGVPTKYNLAEEEKKTAKARGRVKADVAYRERQAAASSGGGGGGGWTPGKSWSK